MIDIGGEYPIIKDEIVEIRLATDSEKKQLFEALAKKNKAWNAEKQVIVDLKPKWTPKPFDKIVAFEEISKEWVCLAIIQKIMKTKKLLSPSEVVHILKHYLLMRRQQS